MYCDQCGTKIPDESNFCAHCGRPVGALSNAQATEPVDAPRRDTESFQKPDDPAKTKKRKIYLISACAVILAVAILFAVIGIIKASQYKNAVALMEVQENAQAKEAFISLGGYKDSAALAETCQNQLDYDAAKALMDTGEHDAAKQAFEALNDFGQAPLMAVECQNIMEYTAAVALMDDTRYEEARDAFTKLGAYQDSAQLAADCQNRLDYDNAAALMDCGEYDLAAKIFLALGEYSDAAARAEECQDALTYQFAKVCYSQGSYYLAYSILTGLGDYSDAAACAQACIQPNPDSGELYRNPEYSSKRCSLTIKTGDAGNSTFLKIYTGDGILVSTVFIASKKKVTVKLPTGTYRMKAAYGWDWFGADDMFGDDGYYELLLFENSAEVTSLKSNYIYTLSIGAEGSDGNVGSRQEERQGF